jgi:hypothetical protein
MRKETIKMAKEDPRISELKMLAGKHSYSSMHEFRNIHAFKTVDDEEYFFEVEDY